MANTANHQPEHEHDFSNIPALLASGGAIVLITERPDLLLHMFQDIARFLLTDDPFERFFAWMQAQDSDITDEYRSVIRQNIETLFARVTNGMEYVPVQ